MNIFYLDSNPRFAARFHCDKHVIKMILESAQLLSTAVRLSEGRLCVINKRKRWLLPFEAVNGEFPLCYQATHVNHPSAIWVRQNRDHYRWLYNLFCELNGEYFCRYRQRDHASFTKLAGFLSNVPSGIPEAGDFLEPPQAMPDDCKVEGNSVQAYRNYYMVHKRSLATWQNVEKPWWWT